jgi:hypothetical protein
MNNVAPVWSPFLYSAGQASSQVSTWAGQQVAANSYPALAQEGAASQISLIGNQQGDFLVEKWMDIDNMYSSINSLEVVVEAASAKQNGSSENSSINAVADRKTQAFQLHNPSHLVAPILTLVHLISALQCNCYRGRWALTQIRGVDVDGRGRAGRRTEPGTGRRR